MRFVTLGQFSLNLDTITFVDWTEPGQHGGQLEAAVHFVGVYNPSPAVQRHDFLRLRGRDAERLRTILRDAEAAAGQVSG